MLWKPSPRRIARGEHHRIRREVGARHGVDVPTTTRSGAGRSTTRRLLARGLGLRRRRRHAAAIPWWRTPTGCPAPLVSRRPAQLRAEPARARRADDAGDALVFWGEDKVTRRVSHAELHALASRASAALAAAGRRGRRPRRRVPAQHARGDHRDAGRDVARRDLVVVLAGLRRAGRARPLRPDRAARARHRRRLLVQRQGDADPRQGGRDRRRPAVGRARRRDPVSAANAGRLRRPRRRCATAWRGTSGWRRSCPARSTTSRCRSTIRSTSSIRRGRPACRSASCTAPAARCCST